MKRADQLVLAALLGVVRPEHKVSLGSRRAKDRARDVLTARTLPLADLPGEPPSGLAERNERWVG